MTQKKSMTKKKIANLLRKALLKDGKMAQALYEYELKQHIDYWYQGLKSDGEELVFAVTENSGDIAMVLIMDKKKIYINEQAREKLSQRWGKSYFKNMNTLIPYMAKDLADDIIAVNGMKIQSTSSTDSIPEDNRIFFPFV